MGYDDYDPDELELFDDLESSDELDLEISQTLRRKSTRRNREKKASFTEGRGQSRKRNKNTDTVTDTDTMLKQEGSEFDASEPFFEEKEQTAETEQAKKAATSEPSLNGNTSDTAEALEPALDAPMPAEDDMAELAMLLSGDLTGESDAPEPSESSNQSEAGAAKDAPSLGETKTMGDDNFDFDAFSSADAGNLDDLLSMMGGEEGGDFPLTDFPEDDNEPQPAAGDGLSDILSLDSLMGEEKSEEPENAASIGDLSDVFADSLSAVSSDVSDEDQKLEEAVMNMVPEEAKKKKPGFFSKLFGNVVDDKSKAQFEKEQEQEKKAAFKKSEKERIKRGDLTEEEQRKKEEKEAAIAQTKEEKQEAKKAKQAAAAKKKAEKLERKKQLAAARAEALEVDEGRVNRVGAGIIFAFFALVAAAILVGTSQFSYASSMKQAREYFAGQKYTRAYEEVAGLEVKKADEETYSKILTVMFVNKELNSYQNYYGIHQYDKALDSLLKGLKRYDKYLETARELGVKSDLDHVRSQIVRELEDTYGIAEKDALSMIQIEDREQYSKSVIQAALFATENQ